MAGPLRPPIESASSRSRLTLILCTVLHAFTHAYGTLLVPLYLLIVADLKLGGVKAASLIVTLYGLVYCLGSYVAGVLADRHDRRLLLGIGLLGNATAVLLMGLTRRYEVLLALGIAAGIAGTLFHPAANALVPGHFPKSAGMAIGLLGIGSGLGFYAGPQYAGWRAQTAHWHLPLLGPIADWQRPCVELGAAGLVFGAVFLLVARETPERQVKTSRSRRNGQLDWIGRSDFDVGRSMLDVRCSPLPTDEHRTPNTQHPTSNEEAPNDAPVPHYASLQIDRTHALGPALRRRVLMLAAILGCRDFAGVAGLSLASIYLQKAHHLDAARAGFVVGTMMLLSIFVNPLAVWLTPGRRRLPALAAVMVVGGAFAAAIPFVPLRHTLAVLCAFQTCQMGSYAISDAGMLERVAPALRGRVVGLFLMVAGTFASTSPWVMGYWTDHFGPRAADPAAYAAPFATLAVMMLIAVGGIPFIARLGKADQPRIEPFTATSSVTMEPVG